MTNHDISFCVRISGPSAGPAELLSVADVALLIEHQVRFPNEPSDSQLQHAKKALARWYKNFYDAQHTVTVERKPAPQLTRFGTVGAVNASGGSRKPVNPAAFQPPLLQVVNRERRRWTLDEDRELNLWRGSVSEAAAEFGRTEAAIKDRMKLLRRIARRHSGHLRK